MDYIVFDIETQNTFRDVGKREPALLDISLVGIYDSRDDAYESFLEDELDDLWPRLEQADALVGYNSDHFDIPLLDTYYHGNLTHIKSIDIMKTIEEALGRRIGLDAVAEATLNESKSGHGLQATTWWKQGKIEKIRTYCLDDVKVTKKLFDYIQENEHIKFKDHRSGDIRTVELDISSWDKKGSNGMTRSLGF